MTIPSDPEAIRTLAHILRDTGLTEIEIVSGDDRLRLVRALAPVQAALAQVPIAAPGAGTVAGPLASPAAPAEEVRHPGTVPSPMVGVAYLSAEPGSAPFATPGQAVTVGQTIMLIEAMKTFNQIKAPRAGMLIRLLVVSGQPVEYDQPLFVIE